jgi:lysozyme family protein
MDLFEQAMVLTLGHEGGWYDGTDPRDPNPTMYGVTQRRFDEYSDAHGLPRLSVKHIGPIALREIYRAYWDGTCDAVAQRAPLTAHCLFDMAINAGPATARRILQRALDLVEDGDLGDLADDGKLGPNTLAVIRRLGPGDDEVLCLWTLMERVRYYDEAAQSPRLRPNLKSWVGRTMWFYDEFVRKR